MICHIEFLEPFAVKVSNSVRKKIKKNYRLIKKKRQNKLELFSPFPLLGSLNSLVKNNWGVLLH